MKGNILITVAIIALAVIAGGVTFYAFDGDVANNDINNNDIIDSQEKNLDNRAGSSHESSSAPVSKESDDNNKETKPSASTGSGSSGQAARSETAPSQGRGSSSSSTVSSGSSGGSYSGGSSSPNGAESPSVAPPSVQIPLVITNESVVVKYNDLFKIGNSVMRYARGDIQGGVGGKFARFDFVDDNGKTVRSLDTSISFAGGSISGAIWIDSGVYAFRAVGDITKLNYDIKVDLNGDGAFWDSTIVENEFKTIAIDDLFFINGKKFRYVSGDDNILAPYSSAYARFESVFDGDRKLYSSVLAFADGVATGTFDFEGKSHTIRSAGNITKNNYDIQIDLNGDGTFDQKGNKAPIVSDIPGQFIGIADQTLSINFTASDPEGGNLTFSMELANGTVLRGTFTNKGNNEWNYSTTISLTPGTYGVKLIATDDKGLTLTKRFTLTVSGPSVAATMDNVTPARTKPNGDKVLLAADDNGDGNINDTVFTWSSGTYIDEYEIVMGKNRIAYRGDGIAIGRTLTVSHQQLYSDRYGESVILKLRSFNKGTLIGEQEYLYEYQPGPVVLAAAVENNTVKLTWSDNHDSVYFRIYRDDGDGVFRWIYPATTISNYYRNYYIDQNLTIGKTYRYYVTNYISPSLPKESESGPSNVVNVSVVLFDPDAHLEADLGDNRQDIFATSCIKGLDNVCDHIVEGKGTDWWDMDPQGNRVRHQIEEQRVIDGAHVKEIIECPLGRARNDACLNSYIISAKIVGFDEVKAKLSFFEPADVDELYSEKTAPLEGHNAILSWWFNGLSSATGTLSAEDAVTIGESISGGVEDPDTAISIFMGKEPKDSLDLEEYMDMLITNGNSAVSTSASECRNGNKIIRNDGFRFNRFYTDVVWTHQPDQNNIIDITVSSIEVDRDGIPGKSRPLTDQRREELVDKYLQKYHSSYDNGDCTRITTPVAGSEVRRGTLSTIRWTPLPGVESVKIELLELNTDKTEIVGVSSIATNVPNNGEYKWAYKNTPGKWVIRIYDNSKNPFELRPPDIAHLISDEITILEGPGVIDNIAGSDRVGSSKTTVLRFWVHPDITRQHGFVRLAYQYPTESFLRIIDEIPVIPGITEYSYEWTNTEDLTVRMFFHYTLESGDVGYGNLGSNGMFPLDKFEFKSPIDIDITRNGEVITTTLMNAGTASFTDGLLRESFECSSFTTTPSSLSNNDIVRETNLSGFGPQENISLDFVFTPYLDGRNCAYRADVVNKQDSSIENRDELSFIFSEEPSIHIDVTSPTTGKTWGLGTQQTITWNADSTFVETIDIYADPVVKAAPIMVNGTMPPSVPVPKLIARDAPNNGEYSWIVGQIASSGIDDGIIIIRSELDGSTGNSILAAGEYKIRVKFNDLIFGKSETINITESQVVSPDSPGISEEAVTITSPNGGQQFTFGEDTHS